MILQHSALAVAKNKSRMKTLQDAPRCFFPLSLSCFENVSQFGAVCSVPKETDLILRSIIINWRNKLPDEFEWCRFHQR